MLKLLNRTTEFRLSRILVTLIAIFSLLVTPQGASAAQAVPNCTSTTVDGSVTSSGGGGGASVGDVCWVAANCAALLGAAAIAGAAIGSALTAVGTGVFGVGVGNLQAAVQLGSWELVLAELRALLATLNTIAGAGEAAAYVVAAIAKVQAVIALMGTEMYKTCQKPLIDAGDVFFGPPEGGTPGVVHIPPATCGHEPNGPGRGWIQSCSQCCTKNVDDANDHCPATRDPAKTNCANLVNECTSGCEQYRRDVSNGSRGQSSLSPSSSGPNSSAPLSPGPKAKPSK